MAAGTARLWVWGAGVAILAGVLAWGSYLLYEHGRSVERAGWQARWAVRDAGDQQAWGLAEGEARTEEQRRQAAINRVADDARKEQASAVDDAGRADAAGDRLHVAANELASRASCTSEYTGATERGEAARRAAMVLSDLLSRADKRAGELAAAYDRARIAGLTCESSYQALTTPRR